MEVDALERSTLDLTVVYNGIERIISVHEEHTIKVVLGKSVKAFGPLRNPHTLAHFTEDGEELPDDARVKDTKIHHRCRVLLRPSCVKGGRKQ